MEAVAVEAVAVEVVAAEVAAAEAAAAEAAAGEAAAAEPFIGHPFRLPPRWGAAKTQRIKPAQKPKKTALGEFWQFRPSLKCRFVIANAGGGPGTRAKFLPL